jgi:hypothetical protein
MFPWPKFRRAKGGVKAIVLLDPAGRRFSYAQMVAEKSEIQGPRDGASECNGPALGELGIIEKREHNAGADLPPVMFVETLPT